MYICIYIYIYIGEGMGSSSLLGSSSLWGSRSLLGSSFLLGITLFALDFAFVEDFVEMLRIEYDGGLNGKALNYSQSSLNDLEMFACFLFICHFRWMLQVIAILIRPLHIYMARKIGFGLMIPNAKFTSF